MKKIHYGTGARYSPKGSFVTLCGRGARSARKVTMETKQVTCRFCLHLGEYANSMKEK